MTVKEIPDQGCRLVSQGPRLPGWISQKTGGAT